MRIIQLITDRQRRGAQVFASQLTDQLHDVGHQVLLVSLYSLPNITSMVKAERGDNIYMDAKKKPLSFSLLRSLRLLIIRYEPDIIQANGSDTLKYMVIAARTINKKYVLVYRNISMAGRWIDVGFKKNIYRLFFSFVDHVVSLSEKTKVEFQAVYDFPTAKISVIPIGTFLNEKISKENERLRMEIMLGSKPEGHVILHIGSFSNEKNHKGLLRIFKNLKVRFPLAILILAGEGPQEMEIRKLVESLDLNGSVIFVGSRTDIQEWIGGADVFFLPSVIEGLPGVVLEAMAHKVPVVAYNVGALDELIENEKEGSIVSFGDEPAFMDEATRLLEDENTRIRFGESAFRRVKEKYDINVICAKFETLYRRLIA